MTPPLPNFTTLISSACGVSYVYFFLACATVPFPVVIYLVSYDPPLNPPGLSGLSLFLLNKIWGSPARKIQFLVGKLNLRLRVLCEDIGFWIGEISQIMLRLSLGMSSYVLLPQRLAVEYSSAARV